MRFLRRHFNPLTADEFHSSLERGRFPAGACLVTFDDGWQDNELHALPILQGVGVPAALFVATGYVGTGNTFWQERLTRQLFALNHDPGLGRSTLASIGIPIAFGSSDDAAARHDVRGFVDRLKLSTTAEIERVGTLVSTACRQIGLVDGELGDDRFLDWSAVKRMASTGLVTIGSHAHSHVPLSRLGREAAAADLQQSVREIVRHGLPAPVFCAYPNGDFDATTLDCLADTGIRVGFTTEPGHISPGDDPRRLARVNIHGDAAATAPEFLCRILGIF